jgi:hypothetical protein
VAFYKDLPYHSSRKAHDYARADKENRGRFVLIALTGFLIAFGAVIAQETY